MGGDIESSSKSEKVPIFHEFSNGLCELIDTFYIPPSEFLFDFGCWTPDPEKLAVRLSAASMSGLLS